MNADELASGTSAAAMATVFDSFLQGISILARDNTALDNIDAAITQVMQTWDIAVTRKAD